jgi:hypothetical protein
MSLGHELLLKDLLIEDLFDVGLKQIFLIIFYSLRINGWDVLHFRSTFIYFASKVLNNFRYLELKAAFIAFITTTNNQQLTLLSFHLKGISFLKLRWIEDN